MNLGASGTDNVSGQSFSPISFLWRARYSLVFLTDLSMREYIFPLTIRASSSVQGAPGSDKDRHKEDSKRVGTNIAIKSKYQASCMSVFIVMVEGTSAKNHLLLYTVLVLSGNLSRTKNDLPFDVTNEKQICRQTV